MPKSADEKIPQDMAELGRLGGRAKKIEAVERRIRDLVDNAPPISEAQRDRLVQLLRGAA